MAQMVILKTHPLTGEINAKVTPSELLDGLLVAHAKEDKERLEAIAARRGKDAIRYVGRQINSRYGDNSFGNPFSPDPRSTAPNKTGSLAEAVEKHAAWLSEPAQAPLRKRVQEELKGKLLVCHCSPMGSVSPCHAQTLARLANPQWSRMEDPLLVDQSHKNFVHEAQFDAWIREHGLEDSPKVLVTGDRNFRNRKVVVEQMRELGPGAVIIEGEARGADELARDAAVSLGFNVAGFPAQWDPKPGTPERMIKTRPSDGKRYVPSAGIRRNERMAKCNPDQVIAFHDSLEMSRGTKNMVQQAIQRGLPVRVVNSKGEVLHGEQVLALVGEADAPAPDNAPPPITE